jgi:LytR cell envelope-related transcriptional attenuator
VLVGVAVLVVILSSLGGGGSGATSATNSGSAAGVHAGANRPKSHARRVSTAASPAASRAGTSVAVLNGTETEGLAHKISGNLRQSGYTQATALNGRPPGSNQVTVVEYARGHLTDAQGVARSLGVTRVQPIEPSTASLSGSATVVVIVGLDKAATVP